MPRIDKLYAWVIAHKDEDDEGVPAVEMPDRYVMPLMGADMPRVESMQQIVQDLANSEGKPIKLIRSTGIEVVEIVYPEAKQ